VLGFSWKVFDEESLRFFSGLLSANCARTLLRAYDQLQLGHVLLGNSKSGFENTTSNFPIQSKASLVLFGLPLWIACAKSADSRPLITRTFLQIRFRISRVS
jgi:hypothetical protein